MVAMVMLKMVMELKTVVTVPIAGIGVSVHAIDQTKTAANKYLRFLSIVYLE